MALAFTSFYTHWLIIHTCLNASPLGLSYFVVHLDSASAFTCLQEILHYPCPFVLRRVPAALVPTFAALHPQHPLVQPHCATSLLLTLSGITGIGLP